MEKIYKSSKYMAYIIFGLAILRMLSYGIRAIWSNHQISKIEELRSQRELLEKIPNNYNRYYCEEESKRISNDIWDRELKIRKTSERWLVIPSALLFLAAYGSLLCYFIMLKKRTGNGSKLTAPIIMGMISSALCILLIPDWVALEIDKKPFILSVVSISALIATFIMLIRFFQQKSQQRYATIIVVAVLTVFLILYLWTSLRWRLYYTALYYLVSVILPPTAIGFYLFAFSKLKK